jgi:integrase
MASFQKRGRVWYFAYIDADGRRIERKGCADKRSTEELARAAESQAAKIKPGLVDPRDLARREHATGPIAEHVAEWGDAIQAKGGTAQHVALSTSRVRSLIAVVRGAAMADVKPPKTSRRAELAAFDAKLTDWLTPARLGDLTVDRVQGGLKSLMNGGLGLTSVNHYKTAVKMFLKWARRSGRMESDSLAGLTGYNAKEDRRHDRRTISLEELQRLIEAARTGPAWRGMTWSCRAICYRLAVATGLRYGEIQSITPESFDWATDPATVTVEAGYTKNGDPATLPLPADLANDLRRHVAGAIPGEPVFALTDDRGSTMLRVDLERAGVPYLDASGLVFDFHSLRCQTATLLDAVGVTPRVAQRIMRHSTPGLADRYTKPRAVDVERAALSMPSLVPKPGRELASSQLANGTDGQPIDKRFAAHLPHAGDGVSRNESEADATAALLVQPAEKPKPCERRELAASDGVSRGEKGMGRGRVELPTHGFSVRCSTN